MAWNPERVVAVVNPAAAGGKVGRRWDNLQGALIERLGPVEFQLTRAPGDATRLAQEAVENGAEVVLSLGGDGTHGEVAAGLYAAGGLPTLGILPAGTGGDFRRMLAHGEDLMASAAALPTATATTIDLGRVDYGTGADAAHRIFLNLAGLGMSGQVDRYVNASSKRLGGTLTFLWCTLKALMRFRPPRVRLTVDGIDRGEHCIFTVIVANGRYAGGGMQFAPDARLDDGRFDVIVIPKRPLHRAIWAVPGLYSGRYIKADDVHVWRAAELKIDVVDDRTALLDIDGESPGQAPACFTIIPSAIRLLDLEHRPMTLARTLPDEGVMAR
ncbi:MAG: diacylglycerol kinase (ATP) [Bradymonadia bacterium]|jgi:diacylglycerol kinase (ATP)